MSDKHFMLDSPRVYLTYWEGPIPQDFYTFLNHNCEFFDETYVVLIGEEQPNPILLNKKVTIFNTTRQEILDLIWYKETEFTNKALQLCPGSFSDFIFYFSVQIVNKLKYKCLNNTTSSFKVLYTDLRYTFYSHFLVNFLFRKWEPYRALNTIPATNHYPGYAPSYLSGGIGFSVYYTDTDRYKVAVEFYHKLKSAIELALMDDRYTALGPSLLNKEEIKPLIGIIPIPNDEIDPKYLYKGKITYNPVPGCLGLGYSGTLVKTAGFVATDFQITSDYKTEIAYEKCIK